jgi:hypothetical protein
MLLPTGRERFFEVRFATFPAFLATFFFPAFFAVFFLRVAMG